MTNKHLTVVGILLHALFICGFSQNNCGCDYIIDPTLANGISFAPWKTGAYYLNPSPGQTICLYGNYVDLRIEGITGNATNPITIKNMCDSVATFNSTASRPPFFLNNCQYVKITGTGTPSVTYGFQVDCNSTAGVSVTGTSVRNIEIDHVEIKKTGFAGFMIKQDPTCDSATWFGNLTYHNINVHDNYVHDVAGEGFYIGNSFWQGGMTRTCGSQTITVYPHQILGLKIHHNIVKNTGWDGIQYGCSPNAEVYDNYVENTGTLKVSQQMSGVQIGGGSGGRFYNNTIINSNCALTSVGFIDTVRIYNNLIINASDGIFADTRDSIKTPKIEWQAYNNTLINIVNTAMKVYDNGYSYKNSSNQWVYFPKGYKPRVKNNVIIGPYFDVKLILNDPNNSLDSSNNYKLKTPFSSPTMQYFVPQKLALFSDTVTYKPSATSYLIDNGTSAVSSVVTFDKIGISRPQGLNFDLGTYEYQSVAPPPSLVINSKGIDNQIFTLYPSVVKDILNINIPQLSQHGTIIIINTLGIIEKAISVQMCEREQVLNIDTNNFVPGYYRVILKNGAQVLNTSFIKH